MDKFDYSGGELQIFALAKNWKRYWSDEIKYFVGDKVLEVGAGIGATAKTLNFKRYRTWVGLEPDAEMCSVIQREANNGNLPENFEIRNETSSSLNKDEMFDTILYVDVLEHIEDDKAELCRIEKHLVNGGNIIIVAPAHNILYSEFDRKIGHFRRYNKAMLRSVVPQGLELKKLRYLDSVGLLASLANKLLLRSSSPTHRQIHFWDSYMVTSSRFLDLLWGHQIGKSIVCVLGKEEKSTRAAQ